MKSPESVEQRLRDALDDMGSRPAMQQWLEDHGPATLGQILRAGYSAEMLYRRVHAGSVELLEGPSQMRGANCRRDVVTLYASTGRPYTPRKKDLKKKPPPTSGANPLFGVWAGEVAGVRLTALKLPAISVATVKIAPDLPVSCLPAFSDPRRTKGQARALHSVLGAGIKTIGELASRRRSQLLAIHGCGYASVEIIERALFEVGYRLSMNLAEPKA